MKNIHGTIDAAYTQQGEPCGFTGMGGRWWGMGQPRERW